eukprot:4003812-Pleurochrysis_carterae.AAC.2
MCGYVCACWRGRLWIRREADEAYVRLDVRMCQRSLGRWGAEGRKGKGLRVRPRSHEVRGQRREESLL